MGQRTDHIASISDLSCCWSFPKAVWGNEQFILPPLVPYLHYEPLPPQLVRQYGVNKDLLPPKKISGNLSKQLIDKRRQLLESYLQKIVHSERQVSQSPELQVFLDVPTHVSPET